VEGEGVRFMLQQQQQQQQRDNEDWWENIRSTPEQRRRERRRHSDKRTHRQGREEALPLAQTLGRPPDSGLFLLGSHHGLTYSRYEYDSAEGHCVLRIAFLLGQYGKRQKYKISVARLFLWKKRQFRSKP
jgi:hypothetical protein